MAVFLHLPGNIMEAFLEKDSQNPTLLIYFPASFIDILIVLTESIFIFLRTLPFSLRSHYVRR